MKLYTAKEIADVLKVHIKTVYRLGRQGEITRVKVGRSVRFAMPQIGDEYVERQIEKERTVHHGS